MATNGQEYALAKAIRDAVWQTGESKAGLVGIQPRVMVGQVLTSDFGALFPVNHGGKAFAVSVRQVAKT